ncbi:MAG: copper-binding protein [Hyphomicrobiales bacterium]|nr:copper-binding protein [Rhodoblastus sp.]MDE2361165.1 copper-binding protein [Hyphomicrobiales bacterium]HRY01616.1 copper-binding protein [Beijerinckiaceae bacterium]
MNRLISLAASIVLATSVAAVAQSTPFVAGKIVKVDTSAGKITIDHQPIPNLDMGAMTMVYRAADPALLKAVKAGEKVRFKADSVNGQLTVTAIEKAK